MRHSMLTSASIAVVLLAGCSDEDQNVAAFCQPIGGAGATTSSECIANCGQENIPAAVDARFDTWAVLHTSVQSEGVLRGNAPDGVAFPEGGFAGVYLHKPPLVNGATFEITLTTYLDGVVVDGDVAFAEGAGGNVCNFRCEPHGDNLFVGIPAEGAFDAIEIAYNQSGGTQSREIKLYEFCVRPE